jgi:peroxiredoxin Q/BCP
MATKKKASKKKPSKKAAAKKPAAAKKKTAAKKKPAAKQPAAKKKAAAKKKTAAKKKPAAKQPAAKKKTAATTSKPPPSDVELQVGDEAPDFDLLADDGERYSKASLAGQRYVLYFYPRDNTPGCTIEAKEFTELLPNFEELGVVVLGVSTDSVESHAKFRSKQELGVVLLSDNEHAASTAYGAWGEKSMYGKPVVGMVRSTFVVGPDGRIEKNYVVRKAAGHAKEVLEYVQSRVDESGKGHLEPVNAPEDPDLEDPQTGEDDEPPQQPEAEIVEGSSDDEHDDQDELADDMA